MSTHLRNIITIRKKFQRKYSKKIPRKIKTRVQLSPGFKKNKEKQKKILVLIRALTGIVLGITKQHNRLRLVLVKLAGQMGTVEESI